MIETIKEMEAFRVKKGETVFLRPTERLSIEQMEEIKRCIGGIDLPCQIVVLPTELTVNAIAE